MDKTTKSEITEIANALIAAISQSDNNKLKMSFGVSDPIWDESVEVLDRFYGKTNWPNALGLLTPMPMEAVEFDDEEIAVTPALRIYTRNESEREGEIEYGIEATVYLNGEASDLTILFDAWEKDGRITHARFGLIEVM